MVGIVLRKISNSLVGSYFFFFFFLGKGQEESLFLHIDEV